MAWIRAEWTEEVAAAPAACFAALADVESWPAWQDWTSAVRVLDRGEDGRPSLVETEAATPLRPLRYVMRYAWEEPSRLSWTQVESDLRDVRGEWCFEPVAAGTRATLVVEGDPGPRFALVMRGPVFDQLRDWLLARALAELRARVLTFGKLGSQ